MKPSHPVDKLSSAERRAGASLASLFGLRMLGLFLVLPVFAVYAGGLPGGESLTLVGLALGAYGLTQALLQIPFGVASDRWGRKPVIALGLLLFAGGSVVAALAPDIYWMLAGRALQGAGAISAAVTALAADLTREQHRTKVMAMIGSSIGLVFAASLVIAPPLFAAIGMRGIFLLIAVLALVALPVLYMVVPPQPLSALPARKVPVGSVLRDMQLLRLDFGIFILHAVQMAMFVVIPRALAGEGGLPVGKHWQVYLPVVLASFLVMVPVIVLAERRRRLRPTFVAAVVLLFLTQIGLALWHQWFWATVLLLFSFFTAFNLLEALLPSLISRVAPPQGKGAAMGVYNTAQALGAALGGLAGGALAQHLGTTAVFEFATLATVLWLAAAFGMKPPPLLDVREYALKGDADIDTIRQRLAELPGVREAFIVPERRVACLKIIPERWDERRLQQLIQGEV